MLTLYLLPVLPLTLVIQVCDCTGPADDKPTTISMKVDCTGCSLPEEKPSSARSILISTFEIPATSQLTKDGLPKQKGGLPSVPCP